MNRPNEARGEAEVTARAGLQRLTDVTTVLAPRATAVGTGRDLAGAQMAEVSLCQLCCDIPWGLLTLFGVCLFCLSFLATLFQVPVLLSQCGHISVAWTAVT